MNNELIEQVIKDRLKTRLKDINFGEFGLKEIYIAGNSLNRMNPNDFDIFPVSMTGFSNIKNTDDYLSKTKNATTVKYKDYIIQFCNYYHPTLKDLVESFDFAHIKIGAKVVENTIVEIYISDDYKTSRIIEGSYYTHSEFPTSSLIRLFKYQSRGDLPGKKYIFEALKIIVDIAQRGFLDYEDFKNQIDAVDLGLVPEDLSGCQEVLINLFNAFKKQN